MKSMSGHLFFTFILIVGSVLAVLGLVLGQLFPFFAKEYNERQTEIMEQRIEQSVDSMNLSLSEQEELLQTIIISEEQSQELMAQELKRLMFVIVVLLICGFIIIWLSTSNILRNFLEPIINVTNTAKELAVGNYRSSAYASGL